MSASSKHTTPQQRQRWTLGDVAEYLGVTRSTVRAYASRGQMPAPDAPIDGRTPGWWADTVRDWHLARRRVHQRDNTGNDTGTGSE